MSRKNLINGLLGLQGWEVMEEEVVLGEEEVVIPIVRGQGESCCCRECGQAFLWAYDHLASRRVRDFPIWGRRCWLEFAPARVDCPRCGVHVEGLDWIEARERQTLRYERYVAALCELMPALDVASLEGLDKNTVYRIDRKWLGRRAELRQQRPVRYLGIDEIAIRKGHRYATLFYDLERREVIGGVLTREERAVSRFFRRWGKAACQGVEAVCTDLWSAYHNSVRRYLKNAEMVFDKFHVLGYLSSAIDQVRRDEQNLALKEEGLQLIKGSRWLWLKNRTRLHREQRQTLDEIMAQNKNLHKAYLLKEDFAEFYTCLSREEAQAFLSQWVRRCKQGNLAPFERLARRLTRWKEGILAYFKHHITNAVSEGINNKVKVLKRRSYGFHDFEYFVLKIMAATGALPHLALIPHTIRE
jgi:transposase